MTEQNVVSMETVGMPTETSETSPAVEPLKSVNITRVSNGWIAEASRSSLPGEEDPQRRATVHATMDELTTYVEEFFAEEE